MNNNLLVEKIIKSTLEKFQAKYGHNPDYENPVNQMKNIALISFSTNDSNNVIEPFLYTWGKMGRVLGQSRYYNWQQKCALLINSNHDSLEVFRTMALQNTDLDEYHDEIVKLYNAFKSIVDKIAAVKVLHILCPTFFPLWDNAIEKGLRAEYNGGCGCEPFTGHDYFAFMKCVQDLINKYNDLWISSAAFYEKGLLKIVDEYFWWSVGRPFSLVV